MTPGRIDIAAAVEELQRAATNSRDRWRVYTIDETGTPRLWPVKDHQDYGRAVATATGWYLTQGLGHVVILDRWTRKTALALADSIPPSMGIRQ